MTLSLQGRHCFEFIKTVAHEAPEDDGDSGDLETEIQFVTSVFFYEGAKKG